MHAFIRAQAGARPYALLAIFTLIAASPAQAQLGGLVKKAKAAATSEAAHRSGATAVMDGESVAFNDVILELTEDRLDQVIRGLQAGRTDDGANNRASLLSQRDKLSNEAGDLAQTHGTQIDAHNSKRYSVERCRNDAFEKRAAARNAAIQQRVLTDASLRDKVMALSTRLAEAQMKGDTATYTQIVYEARVLSGEGKADTLAVDTSCGTLPAPHPIDRKITALQAQMADLDAQIRAAEQHAADAEARAAGMNTQQFGMARERILMYLTRVKSNSQQRGFTMTELKALESRRSGLAGLV